MTVRKWLRLAEIDDGATPGDTRAEAAELREPRKRIRLLEQEVEVLRHVAAYLSHRPDAGVIPICRHQLLHPDDVPPERHLLRAVQLLIPREG